jgi:hypothetical protein
VRRRRATPGRQRRPENNADTIIKQSRLQNFFPPETKTAAKIPLLKTAVFIFFMF